MKILIIRVLIVLTWGILFSVSQYAIKRFMTDLPGLVPNKENVIFVLSCKWFYIAGTIFPASVILSSLSYRFMPVSSAGPIFFAMGTVISLLIGALCFTETISLIKGMGVGLCMIGIVLIILK